MNRLRQIWASYVSNIIWGLEKVFFYPKLARAYKELNLIDVKGLRDGLVVFDVGANKGQSVKFFKSIYPFSTIYAF